MRKLSKNEDGRVIEGIEIFNLEPIEIVDEIRAKKDFSNLMEKLNVKNLTKNIINMRHKDE